MKLIKEPSVYLTTRTAVNWEAIAEFLAAEGVPPIPDSIRAGDDESAAVVEVSARMCYMSFGRGRRDIADFVTNLLSSKDGSVFEHVESSLVGGFLPAAPREGACRWCDYRSVCGPYEEIRVARKKAGALDKLENLRGRP